MIKYKRGLVQRTIAVLTILCTMLAHVSVCGAAKSFWQEYTLPIQCGETNNYLDVVNKENSWFIEVQSLAKLANCQVQEKNGKVALSRGEVPVILYEAEPNICIITDEKTYLPFQEATTAVGIYFYEKSNTLGINTLKVPKELSQKMEEVFANNQLLLSRMQKDLGWIWDTAQTTARLYSILPFVGSYSFVGAITGENEIQQYEEGFGHILANEGIAYEMLQKFSDFDQLITDSATTLELAEQLTHQDGALKPYADMYGIDEQLMSTLGNEYPEEGYEAGVEEWLSAYTDVTTAMNIKYILDACVLYSATMDAEESMIAAMKSAFEFSGNYNAKVASERIIARRCGSEIDNLEKFYEGWAFDTLSSYISKKLETVIAGDFKPTELATAAITRVIDYGLGASDKANAILFYDIYTSMQNELRRYYNQLCVDKDFDNTYKQRAATIMYLKCGISAYENMEFDDSIKHAVANAQDLFAEYLMDILAFSQQEYAPDYDNQIAIDWLNTYAKNSINPDFIVGKWANEAAHLDDPISSYSNSYYTQFNENGTIMQSGWRNQDFGHYKIDNNGKIIATFDVNKVYSPIIGDYQLLDGYTYTVVYEYNQEDGTLFADYSISFETALYSNAVDGILYKEAGDPSDIIKANITMGDYGGIWHTDYVGSDIPLAELTITSIGNGTITCDLSLYRLYGWKNINGNFISDNMAEINANIGTQYVTFRLVFDVDCITMTVDTTNSDYFETNEQYVFQTRSNERLL